mmetsp:Transcript_28687/g.33127  ORF Transcript_28687/g.33127 Transcript_28687/m.33127 type:complete len:468 (+) Transcript_28687:32-1435(+)
MNGPRRARQPRDTEPTDEFTTMDGATLKSLLPQMRDKLTDILSKRNYIQNDRDMVENFYNNTQKEIDELQKKIMNKETEAEKLEEDHRVEVKAFMQKVKHLEYDQKAANREINQKGENYNAEEDIYHKNWLEDMKEKKQDLKKDITTAETKNQNDVKTQVSAGQKHIDKLQKDFNGRLEVLVKDYERKLAKLKEDLELKLKVEIHEIEERKNLHINELMTNHEKAFAELKSYYNEITAENLALIKAQKKEINGIQDALLRHKKLIDTIRSENRDLQTPLAEAKGKRDKLKTELKQHEKDKMSLANLKTKYITLRDKIAKLTKERDDLFARFAKVKQEKDELEMRFDRITEEVKEHAEIKNVILGERLSTLQSQLEQKEQQLQELVQRSDVDSNVLGQLLGKIQASIESKNGLIKNLKYSIHHATKAYNDAIRVYEAKLEEFGIPPEELGFQTLDSITSTMPAGLVSS